MPRDLQPLFAPRSVAILGASNDPSKWGNWLADGALKGAHRRPVYLVNRNGAEVLGQRTYASLEEIPDAPELVVIAVPAAGFEQAVDASLAKGARALVGITAGLGETGGDAAARERALVERVRAAGAMLLGPNCLGVFDASSELGLASNEFPPGSIGLISQSGNLALELGILARAYGLGFSRFASIGNQADLDLAELVASCAEHDETRLIAVYVEDFRDGRAFVDAAAEAGKPVVLLTVGRTEASVRAARSHTGALVSPAAVVEAAARSAGAYPASTPGEMIDLAQALLQPRRMSGPRIASLGDGGGHGAIAADLAAGSGLQVPALSDDLAAELAAVLPPTAATRNPVDLAGGGEQDMTSFAACTRILLDSGEVDGVLMTGFFGGYSQYPNRLAERELAVADEVARVVADAGRPLVVQSMYPSTATTNALRKKGIPVYERIESAVAALAALRERTRPPGAPALPPQAHPGRLDDSYFGARRLLDEAGVPFIEARLVRTSQQALVAADEIGYPVVLKALGILHKSDQGGVVVGIADADALAWEWGDMEERLAPPEFSVERMAPLRDGVEVIVGARRDPRFGPVAMVGLGGVFAEAFEDVAVGLAPLDVEVAERLLRSLRGAVLFGEIRGREPVDLRAAAEAAVALSQLAASRDDIAEIEVNPLLVTADGALGLDARIIPATEGDDDAG
jgi:acetate---CoA ligase (ADP-forming)